MDWDAIAKAADKGDAEFRTRVQKSAQATHEEEHKIVELYKSALSVIPSKIQLAMSTRKDTIVVFRWTHQAKPDPRIHEMASYRIEQFLNENRIRTSRASGEEGNFGWGSELYANTLDLVKRSRLG